MVMHCLTVEPPEELAEEALERTDTREDAEQFILDRSLVEVDWGDVAE